MANAEESTAKLVYNMAILHIFNNLDKHNGAYTAKHEKRGSLFAEL